MRGQDISKRVFTYTATVKDEGRPVRDIILYRWGMVHHDVARAKYDTQNGITVNGEVSFVNRKLRKGDVLRVILTDFPPENIIPEEHPIEVAYEDWDIICLNKPAGVVVHPSHGHYSDSLANYLAFYFQMKGEPHEIRTVGRLDKDTSGLVLFAKSRTMAAHMTTQADKGIHTKTYYALAEGEFAERSGRIEAPIEREFAGARKRVAREGGDYALTEYEVIRQYEGYAFLRVRIATGRTHQIRVHMSHIGHPLLGDSIYNEGRGSAGPNRAALHAGEIAFHQPFTGEDIRLRARLPDDFLPFLPDLEANYRAAQDFQ
ncbi:MAG: RluA family pseudouridine synthase [Lachnospiraceae bacterium]|nr:RluA family pseudouridine synthase [Lachnospiraceae bacterium]